MLSLLTIHSVQMDQLVGGLPDVWVIPRAPICPPPSLSVVFEAGSGRSLTGFLLVQHLQVMQLLYQAQVPSSLDLSRDALSRLAVLSGLSTVIQADQGATWASKIEAQCRLGAPPADLRGSFEAMAGVFASVGSTMATPYAG